RRAHERGRFRRTNATGARGHHRVVRRGRGRGDRCELERSGIESRPPCERRPSMAQPLTPSALIYDLVTAGDPQISPDGTQVVYALSQTDRKKKKGSSQIWLCGVDGFNPRRLT